jgi:sialidase-1
MEFKIEHKSMLWDAHEITEGSQHVYGLTATKNETILAFAEARIKWHDNAPHHLVLKRGKVDNGKVVWKETQVIEDGDDGSSWSNPAALYDAQNNRVFFFYALNDGTEYQTSTRIFYRYSDDEGCSWSERFELSDIFVENEFGWTFHMPGPGHGIQLKNQNKKEINGRLVLPFWHRKAINCAPRNYGNSILYSDDYGKTWSWGGVAGLEKNTNESRIDELKDGTLVLNSRGAQSSVVNTEKNRMISKSYNAGESFVDTKICPGFEYCNCDSGMLYIEDRDQLLMSCLANKDKTCELTKYERSRLTLYNSNDEGLHWKSVGVIYSGKAQYSDIVRINKAYLGVLYGKGTVGKQDVMFLIIKLEDIF